MRSTSGPITPPKWRHDPTVANVSQWASNNLAIPQLFMPPFPGRVLLLSPVLGGAFASEVGVGFIPPRADQLSQSVSRQEFPRLNQAEIHVGSEDWQSNPEVVRSFGQHVSIPVKVVEGKGHLLGVDYVGPLLDRWLADG